MLWKRCTVAKIPPTDKEHVPVKCTGNGTAHILPAHFDSLDRLTAGRKNQSDECNTAKIKKETVSS